MRSLAAIIIVLLAGCATEVPVADVPPPPAAPIVGEVFDLSAPRLLSMPPGQMVAAWALDYRAEDWIRSGLGDHAYTSIDVEVFANSEGWTVVHWLEVTPDGLAWIGSRSGYGSHAYRLQAGAELCDAQPFSGLLVVGTEAEGVNLSLSGDASLGFAKEMPPVAVGPTASIAYFTTYTDRAARNTGWTIDDSRTYTASDVATGGSLDLQMDVAATGFSVSTIEVTGGWVPQMGEYALRTQSGEHDLQATGRYANYALSPSARIVSPVAGDATLSATLFPTADNRSLWTMTASAFDIDLSGFGPIVPSTWSSPAVDAWVNGPTSTGTDGCL